MIHLLPMVGDKKRVSVADVGSGPHAVKYAEFANGVKVDFFPMDNRDFPNIEKQTMEDIDYPNKSFDIVQCINALDHTKNAQKAVEELIRIADSWVYIDLYLDQHSTSGGWHYWDAKEDGTLENESGKFSLKDYGFEIEYIDNHGYRRYNHIIARWHA